MLVGKTKVSPEIKKQLFLGYALRKQLKEQVSKVGNKTKTKQLFHKALGNEILKRYRIQTYFKDIVSYKMNKKLKGRSFEYERARKKCIIDKYRAVLMNFFEDDTVSRMCPGKRDFVVKKKQKKQRRILLDKKRNLYKRFVSETGIKISYTTFVRACPFWVTTPKPSDRETCSCIKHTNMELKISALKKVRVINQKDANDVLNSLVCSQKNEFCMMGLCDVCDDRQIEFQHEEDFKVKYYQWKTIKEDRIIKGSNKKIVRVVKERVCKCVSDIYNDLKNELVTFKKHVYSYIHQCSKLKHLKANLGRNELIFRIDFSENYVGKHSEEIQSAHFGASKKQVSLHTGIIYVKNKDGQLETKSFCSVSDNLDHQAHAIWAHMDPILK